MRKYPRCIYNVRNICLWVYLWEDVFKIMGVSSQYFLVFGLLGKNQLFMHVDSGELINDLCERGPKWWYC